MRTYILLALALALVLVITYAPNPSQAISSDALDSELELSGAEEAFRHPRWIGGWKNRWHKVKNWWNRRKNANRQYSGRWGGRWGGYGGRRSYRRRHYYG